MTTDGAPVRPKVFVSYAWTSTDHQGQVRSWADRLLADGVDVILDVYDLKEGYDKHAFMERSVRDPLVTHVLIVCDRGYAEKADTRQAGVGTETQLISKEVYEKVEQSRFIPIICEFRSDGTPYLPAFLSSRIGIDFSTPEKVELNWERLLRLLHNRPLLVKPALGNAPAYLLAAGETGASSIGGAFDESSDKRGLASTASTSSVASRVALAKKYCRDDRYALEWVELLVAEVAKIKKFITGPTYPAVKPDSDSINALVSMFTSESEALRRMCLVSGRWGTAEANRAIARVLRSLTFQSDSRSGFTYWIEIRPFPGALCFYWSIVGALAREDFETARALMHTTARTAHGDGPIVSMFPPMSFGTIDWKILKGLENRRTPVSDFMFALLKEEVTDIAIDQSEAEEIFDSAEMLISLEFAQIRRQRMEATGIWFWMPIGRFVWKRHAKSPADTLAAYAGNDALLKNGLLGGSSSSRSQTMALVNEHMQKVPTW